MILTAEYHRTKVVVCDKAGCDRCFISDYTRATEARKQAKRVFFSRLKDSGRFVDLCPRCTAAARRVVRL